MRLRFELINNNKDHIDLLFRLLHQRKHTISHLSRVSYEDHKKFVENYPYLYWYFVIDNDEVIGTIYIHANNSVGINLNKIQGNLVEEIFAFICANHHPVSEVSSVIPGYFYVNVSNSNTELKNVLKDLNLIKIQETYKLSSGDST